MSETSTQLKDSTVCWHAASMSILPADHRRRVIDEFDGAHHLVDGGSVSATAQPWHTLLSGFLLPSAAGDGVLRQAPARSASSSAMYHTAPGTAVGLPSHIPGPLCQGA